MTTTPTSGNASTATYIGVDKTTQVYLQADFTNNVLVTTTEDSTGTVQTYDLALTLNSDTGLYEAFDQASNRAFVVDATAGTVQGTVTDSNGTVTDDRTEPFTDF